MRRMQTNTSRHLKGLGSGCFCFNNDLCSYQRWSSPWNNQFSNLSYKLQVPWEKQTSQEDCKVSPDKWWEWEFNEKVSHSCHRWERWIKEGAQSKKKQNRVGIGLEYVSVIQWWSLTPDAQKTVSEEEAFQLECISKPQSLQSVAA